MTPQRASTYQDPNQVGPFRADSYQDALDFAIVKCALGRPDCVGTTSTSAGEVTVATDGKDFSITMGHPGALQVTAAKIPGKVMKRFQDQMAIANALSPVAAPGIDPNNEPYLRESTGDPNDVQIRITSTLSFKVRTSDGRKGVITVSVSPSMAVRWDLRVK